MTKVCCSIVLQSRVSAAAVHVSSEHTYMLMIYQPLYILYVIHELK
jgi:hypothetical protein